MHPFAVRHFIYPLHERVLRRNTFSQLASLESSQWWPIQRLRELQGQKLQAVLGHAFERCAFYRRRFTEAGIDPATVGLESLAKLPTISKQDIRENLDAMIDASVAGGLHRFTTGGSTGEPLVFMMDRARQAADQAARARSRRWFEIDLGERELYLWGSPVELKAQDRIKSLRDRLTNHRLLSAFEMTPRNMSRYLDEIARFDPVHIFGYPSSIARLCRHAGSAGRRIGNPSLKAVFVTGEVFSSADRAVIEEAVTVPVADGYGSREGGFVAHQCTAGAYHVTMESLIVELLGDDGREVSDGSTGEIVLTHLDWYGMPLIRYRTGDMARRGTGACSCRRALTTLDRIEGRKTDMLLRHDGAHVHALGVIYVLRDAPGVREFKIVQQVDLSLDVMIAADGRFNDTVSERARSLLAKQMGPGVDVRINRVETPGQDPSGKHRHVTSLAL
jgi:phenylacetate-CoA ligase